MGFSLHRELRHPRCAVLPARRTGSGCFAPADVQENRAREGAEWLLAHGELDPRGRTRARGAARREGERESCLQNVP